MANNKNNKKQPIKNNKAKVIAFASIIVLLLLALLIVLSLGNKVKSESEKIMDTFNEGIASEELLTIIYYNSGDIEDNKSGYELEFLKQISKDYNIEYLEIDFSKLNDKDRKEIEDRLGITGANPTTAVVKNNKVVAVQEGYIESNKYVEFLIKAKVLKEGSKYSKVASLTFIDYDKYLDILKKKDGKSVVLVSQAGCQYCLSAKPILNNISKGYKFKINVLEVTDFNKAQLEEFFEELPKIGFDSEDLTENDNFSMPTLLIIEKGRVTSYLEGTHSLEEYVSYFKENKIINS